MSRTTLAVTSRDNPLLVKLRKLTRAGSAYRRTGSVWIEGEHLCSALRARGWAAVQAVISHSGQADAALRELAAWAPRVLQVPDALFADISTLESPSRIGFVIDAPPQAALLADAPTVVLDRVQDAGNVGSILRSASALGFTQVVALEGTAALWSPKVLRAGMGAHFGLQLAEAHAAADLEALTVPLMAADAHAGQSLDEARLPFPCAWVFGHEGQGVDAALLERCAQRLRIPQPGGEESLNVAAAAAICLYATRCGGGRA